MTFDIYCHNMKYELSLKNGNSIFIDFSKYLEMSKRYFNAKKIINLDIKSLPGMTFIEFSKLLKNEYESEKHFEHIFLLRLREVLRTAFKEVSGLGRTQYKRFEHTYYDDTYAQHDVFRHEIGQQDIDQQTELFFYALNFLPLKLSYPLYYFFCGIKLKKIGEAYGVTESRMSQTVSEGKKRMKLLLSDKYLKKIENIKIPVRSMRFYFLSKKEADKKLYRKKYNMRGYKKHFKENPEYYKNRKRSKKRGFAFKQRIAHYISNPEKYRKKIRQYRKKNKEKFSFAEKKRSKLPKRKQWRKDYEKRDYVVERIKLRDCIKNVRSRLKGTSKKGFYKTDKTKEKAIKRMEEAQKKLGKDRRFKD